MPVKITNKNGIPDVFMRACLIDRHVTMGDISVTQLIDAPQIRYLKANHDLEIEAEDMLMMLFGTSVHHILERAEVSVKGARMIMDAVQVLDDQEESKVADYLRNLAREKFPEAFDDSILLEKTLSVTIKTDLGEMEVSGTMDKFETGPGILSDYKVTSVYTYIYEESKKKYYAQQNVYAYMLREHGYTVNKAVISALFRDWKSFDMMRSKDYPRSLAMEIDVPLVAHDKMEKYMQSRVRKHLKIAQLKGDMPCDDKEMWATADAWAIKKKGGKRATKILPNEGLADQWMKDNELKYAGLKKEYRPGERKRCEKFCAVSSVCGQFKEFKK